MSTEVPLLPDPATLPDDPAVLKPLVLQLFEELQKAHGRVQQLEHHMDLLLRRLFGRSSERFDPRQGLLFDLREGHEQEPTAGLAPSDEPKSPKSLSPNRHRHGRGRIPETFERVDVVHDLSEAEQAALGGVENLLPIGEAVSEQYEWKPSTLFVIRHIQKKYARREQLPESGLELHEKNVLVAQKPAQAIPGGLAGPGLLAQVIVSKYGDHLPLYRLERIFQRQGVRFSRQTTDGWVLACAELLVPLHELMKQVVLASEVIHTDDTPVKVRDAHKKRKYTGRFWTYWGDERHPEIVFDYTASRQRDGPAKFLEGYRGYLQADAFGGYDGIYLESNGRILEVGCWAHARRKFFDNRRLDTPRAEIALAWIGKLYAVEKELRRRAAGEWKSLAWEERVGRITAVRQEQSRPLLDQFRVWLEAECPKLLPKSPIRQAMEYTLTNWTALCRYTESGILAIDNNTAENALRSICLGRRNWLFCGSDRGGRAAAIHFSLIASCARHRLDPWTYLRDVLTRLPALLPAANAEALLPLLPYQWHPA
jgi:transposase